MRIALLIEDGQLVGVSLTGAEREPRAGRLRARLTAGPGQELREVEVPDKVVPRTEAPRDVERFFTFLTAKFVPATKRPGPKKRTR
jgi:hypothetical protein